MKGMEPNFATVKLCLVDCLTVDAEFHEILADRWLKPMRNPRARSLVAPPSQDLGSRRITTARSPRS